MKETTNIYHLKIWALKRLNHQKLLKKIILKIQIIIDNSSLELHSILFQVKYFHLFWY